jgi:hypothetical protein
VSLLVSEQEAAFVTVPAWFTAKASTMILSPAGTAEVVVKVTLVLLVVPEPMSTW